MTRLTLTPDGRGGYTLIEDGGSACGSLVVDRRLRHGETVTTSGTVAVHGQGIRRRVIWAGAEGAPLVRLEVPTAILPGRRDARWEIGRDRHRYLATLATADATIRLTLPAGGRGPAQIETSGEWPERDLVILTAAFAVLARRRANTILTAALVSVATSGGGR